MTRVVEEDLEECLSGSAKKSEYKQFGEEMRKEKMMKQRYNVREGAKFGSNKSKYFERLKSYN